MTPPTAPAELLPSTTSSATNGPAGWPSWRLPLAVYALLTVTTTWPVLFHIGSVLPNDLGDPGLNTWILWWNAHAWPLTARWWNAPMFHPIAGALAFSETLVGLSPFTTPLIWLGISPVVVHNLVFVLSFPLAAVAADALARRLTGRRDVAVLAGIAFGFALCRVSQVPHIQLLMAVWMPLGLLALHRYLSEHRLRDLAIFGICWVLNGGTSGYYLVFFGALVAGWVLWFPRAWRDRAVVAATVAVASLPLIPLLQGYAHFQTMYGMARNMSEISRFSADLTGFLQAPAHVFFAPHWTFTAYEENELYVGVTLLVVILAGAIVAWRARPAPSSISSRVLAAAAVVSAVVIAMVGSSEGRRVLILGLAISSRHPAAAAWIPAALLVLAVALNRRLRAAAHRRSAFAFYLLAAVVTALLAMGPVARVDGIPVLDPAPYAALLHIPGGHGLRVPARFILLVVLCLSQAVALAFARLTARGPKPALLAVAAFAMALESWPPRIDTAALPPMLPLGGVDPRAVVLELPVMDLNGAASAMLRATVHGHPIANGFSGYTPPHFPLLQEALGGLDATIFDALRESTPLAIVVDMSTESGRQYEPFLSNLPDATLTIKSSRFLVFSMPARAWPSLPADAAPLPIAAVSANTNPGNVSKMTDGSLDTSWQTGDVQAPGNEVVVELSRPATIFAIEMDLGRDPITFPRKLRMRTAGGDGVERTVWDAGTGGPAVHALLTSRQVVPLILNLPAPALGRRVTLTLETDSPLYPWAVAELKVLGRGP